MNRRDQHHQRNVIQAIALATVALAVSGAHAGITYDAASEFNGSQGGTSRVWQYGRLDASGGEFTQAKSNGSMFESDVWVGASFMHPGGYFTGARANLRFTAPTAGVYAATFSAMLTNPGNDPYAVQGYPDFRRDGVRMWLNNSDFFDLQTWDKESAPQSFKFNTVIQKFKLQAGETIDFSIDPNGARGFKYGAEPSYLGYNIYDSVEYTATVEMIPSPGAIALFGVAGVVAMRRRR